MTTLEERPPLAAEPPGPERRATGLLAALTTTDHKRIGIAYMVTAFAFFLVGGLLALVIRLALVGPGSQVVSQGRYNEMFTMHGSIILFLFLRPFAFGPAMDDRLAVAIDQHPVGGAKMKLQDAADQSRLRAPRRALGKE